MRTDAAHRADLRSAPEPDWATGYGYHFWVSRHGYRGDGAYGQFCLVLPERDAVVALTSATERDQELLDLVWRHLLPALGSPDTSSAPTTTAGALLTADDELANRLAGLALPVPTTGMQGRPGLFTAGDSSAVSMVSTVLLRETEQDYTLELSLNGVAHTMPVGYGRWLAGQWPTEPPIPFVSAGGWDSGRFVVELRMIQTPHLLRMILDPETCKFDSHWREQPMHVPDHTVYAV
jgi:CubicO group peptidase (beta-lactamase class C family)